MGNNAMSKASPLPDGKRFASVREGTVAVGRSERSFNEGEWRMKIL